MCGGRGQMQQCDQDNGRGPGLAGYVIWKSDTKSAAWESLNVGIYLDSSPVSSYSSQITLYRSLHAHWRLIFESTIWEISYSSSLSIMTRTGASYILLEKVLNVVGSSMDTWKTGWTEHMDSEDREWMIECQAERWFYRVQDIFGEFLWRPDGLEELSLDKDFVTYFEIRNGGTSCISRFLIMLLGCRDFSFQGTL